MKNSIEIGRLLRAGTTGFVVGCSVGQFDQPQFGAIVRAPIGDEHDVYGVIQNIRIDDDGLVRQLVSSSAEMSDEILRDNRENRIVPVEMNVMSVGYRQGDVIRHLLPPRPALSLDRIYLCGDEEVVGFTSGESITYLRHLLRADDAPVAELIASHIALVSGSHQEPNRWVDEATGYLIQQLRDDHTMLMNVLYAISEVVSDRKGV